MSPKSANVSPAASQLIPDWVSSLHAFLVRDRDLDPRARDQDGNPTGPREHHHFLLVRLANILDRYGCRRYAAWLWAGSDKGYAEYRGAEGAPAAPMPDEEMAALQAVLGWLRPVPDYPRSITPEQQAELLGLRRHLARAAQDRLNVLDGNGPPDDPFLVFPKLPLRLLRALNGKGKVPLSTVLKAVYPGKRFPKKDTFRKLVERTNRGLMKNKELTTRGIRLEVLSRGEAVWLADISTGEPWTPAGHN